jgi:hypothetical protein
MTISQLPIRFTHTNFPDPSQKLEDEDLLLGAYLISHLKPSCEHCGVTETAQWRRGYFEPVLNRHIFLCNKCGLKYHKNQFCPHCKYIYGKETDKDPSLWLTCNTCGRWVHSKCEQQYLVEHPEENVHTGYQYHCPDCRHRSH